LIAIEEEEMGGRELMLLRGDGIVLGRGSLVFRLGRERGSIYWRGRWILRLLRRWIDVDGRIRDVVKQLSVSEGFAA